MKSIQRTVLTLTATLSLVCTAPLLASATEAAPEYQPAWLISAPPVTYSSGPLAPRSDNTLFNQQGGVAISYYLPTGGAGKPDVTISYSAAKPEKEIVEVDLSSLENFETDLGTTFVDAALEPSKLKTERPELKLARNQLTITRPALVCGGIPESDSYSFTGALLGADGIQRNTKFEINFANRWKLDCLTQKKSSSTPAPTPTVTSTSTPATAEPTPTTEPTPEATAAASTDATTGSGDSFNLTPALIAAGIVAALITVALYLRKRSGGPRFNSDGLPARDLGRAAKPGTSPRVAVEPEEGSVG